MIGEPERGREVGAGAAVVLQWVFRPVLTGPDASPYAVHAGKTVRSVGRASAADGRVDVVLVDGETVRAFRRELRPG
jgi:hypothetical protein